MRSTRPITPALVALSTLVAGGPAAAEHLAKPSAVRATPAAPIAWELVQQEESPAPRPPRMPEIPPVRVQVDIENIMESARVYTRDLEIGPDDVIDGTITMLRGDVAVGGRIRGDVVALDGDVILSDGGVVEGDVHLMRGELVRDGGEVLGRVLVLDPRTHEHLTVEPTGAEVAPPAPSSPSVAADIATGAMSLMGAFIGLAFMGIGLMFFAPRQLEAVADTTWHSFGRSFVTGFLAQPLLVPLLILLVVGLAITIVGILVVPLAVLALLLVVFLAAAGGYIAVARAVGEIYLRRRMAKGLQVTGWLTYRYLLYGLTGVLMIWVPPVLFGRVPVAGTVLTGVAGLFTWILATTGFGAVLLSRAGVRGTVVRRIDRALSNEYLWEPTALVAGRRATRSD